MVNDSFYKITLATLHNKHIVIPFATLSAISLLYMS